MKTIEKGEVKEPGSKAAVDVIGCFDDYQFRAGDVTAVYRV